MGIRQRNQAVIVAALQTDLDSLPTFDYTTDALQVLETPDIKFIRETTERNIVKQTLGATGEIVTSTYVEVTFQVECKGSGVDANGNVLEPRIGRLIQACGFNKTVNTDTAGIVTDIVYTPSSDEFGSATRPAIAFEIYMGLSGTTADKFVVYNAGGNFKFTGNVGNYAILEFTFTGQLYSGPTTITVPSVTYETTQPSPFLGANIIFDNNTSFVFNSVNIDTGNNIIIRKDANEETGIKGVLLGKRHMTATLDPEATFANDYDWIGLLKQGHKASLSIGPVGSEVGNKYSMNAPAAQLTGVDHANRDDILTFDVNLLLTEVNGDDELSITFT